ncbi:hypothetical protein TeGR_g7942, partial [Tetraparma gracilis]
MGSSSSSFPFIDTAPNWNCADGDMLSPSPASVSCSHYKNQTLPCEPGTFSPAGAAPDGACPESCPPHLPFSHPGSTSLSACSTFSSNLIIASSDAERIITFDAAQSTYAVALEVGGGKPDDVTCLSETTCLFSDHINGVVKKLHVSGAHDDVAFAVGAPTGILHIPDLGLTAVASWSVENLYQDGAILFYDEFGELGGQPLPSSPAAGFPLYMALGENPDKEILFTTERGTVQRRCVPSTSCKAAVVDKQMLQPFGLALRPGLFPGNSEWVLEDGSVAGVALVSSLLMLDAYNNTVGGGHSVSAEELGLKFEASGLITGIPATIAGNVAFGGGEPHSGMEASVVIQYSGDWTLHMVQETGGTRQHFINSPSTVTVHPGPTDPPSCTATFSKFVTAGTPFTASVAPADRFGNPTEHDADVFVWFLEGSTKQQLPDRSFSVVPTVAGS